MKYWQRINRQWSILTVGFILTLALVSTPRLSWADAVTDWDVVNARIYLGLRFRTANEDARRQGRQVAKWVFKRFLRPRK
jgi:hypothetical protein